ncbi:DUF736 family protein [Magnetovibrio blakemorei]|uniref:DUF736 domain-containing protein n=1 Tax=Magnetovibrio blakemorei TaxID=28181 RepID=A0A1E5Q514_9PROT|nr:DUF736 family protein [Magnetovibrio blakemorei]OEJ64663.1 hypothetical protein BEN30_00800 [Magnetovibrio blakemorei]
MAIECGYVLRRDVEGKPTVYAGEIDFGNIIGDFYLIPVAEKRDPVKSPDYEMKMKSRSGQYGVVGQCWVKKLKAGGSFFSITVDHPHMTDKPIYLAAFPDDEQPKDTPKGKPANFTLRWSRPKAGNGGQDFGGAPSPSSVDNDSIPY